MFLLDTKHNHMLIYDTPYESAQSCDRELNPELFKEQSSKKSPSPKTLPSNTPPIGGPKDNSTTQLLKNR